MMDLIERRRDPFRVQPGPQLGRRLMRAVALSVSTALLVAGLSFDAYVYFSLRSAMADDLTAQAHIVADNSSAAVLFGDSGAAAQTLSGLQSSEAIESASLHDLQDRMVAAYGAPGLRTQRVDPAPLPPPLANEGHRFAQNRLQVRVPVREGDRVVGHVLLSASLRPLYERACMVVAPIFWGGGVWIKLLEGLACGLPAVTTALAAEGIDIRHGASALFAEQPDAFAGAIVQLLDSPALRMRLGAAGRAVVERDYDAISVGKRLAELYEAHDPSRRGAAR